MRPQFLYLGLALLLVGSGLGVYWLNSPDYDNTIGIGNTYPASSSNPVPLLAFYYPTNETTTITVSYAYGDANTTATLWACPANVDNAYCGTNEEVLTGPLRTTTGADHISGPNGQGTYAQLPMGPYHWYVVETNEPQVVVVKAQPTLLSNLVEGSSLALLIGGLGLSIASPFLRDPSHRPTPRLAQLKRTLYFFFQNRLAVVGLALLVFFMLVAIFAPVLAPTSPAYYSSSQGPVSQYGTPFTNPIYCAIDASNMGIDPCAGTNVVQAVCITPPCSVGGDVLSAITPNDPGILSPTWKWTSPFNLGPMPFGSLDPETSSTGVGATFLNTYVSLVRATPIDLFLSASVVISGALIGIILGALSGFMGGYTDEIVMRVTDIFLSIPALLLTIIILIVFTAGSASFTTETILVILVLSFVITWWPGYTRLVRGQVLVTREQKYIEASRASGAGTGRILGRHIVPNSIYPIFVQMSLDVGTVPILFGTLAYLGFDSEIKLASSGGMPLLPEWGSLSAAGVSYHALSTILVNTSAPVPWWQFLIPGVALFLFAIAVSFLADGLRDALDPRLRR